MLQKYLLAFALGGVLTGGIVYLTRRPSAAPPPPAAPTTAIQPQAAVAPPTETAPASEVPTPPVEQPSKPAISVRQPAASPRSARRRENPPPAMAREPIQPAATAQANSLPPWEPPSQAPAQPQASPRHEAAQSGILRPDTTIESKRRTPQTLTIPSGTTLAIRLRQLVSTDRQAEGDPFAATLDEPIVIDGFVIADKGSNVRGKITSLVNPGRVKGRAAISLELTEINTTDGQRVDIRTDTYRNEAASGKKGDVAKVGAGAAIGAIIGAIAGGGKGAAIGAGVGGTAGGGAVLATKGEDVRLTSETRLTFRLTENVTLTEKLN